MNIKKMLGFDKFIKTFYLLILITILSSGCLSPEKQSITVGAASDLYNAFTEIGKMYENKTGNKVLFLFGSTGTLSQQIEGGAPIDVFASANIDYIEKLKQKGLLINDSIKLYAQGRIVLAINKNSNIKLTNISELSNPKIKKIAIANPTHAPYGIAAKEALENSGIWDEVKPKLVYGENVRSTLIYIQRGEVDAGIIALSIADVPEIEYVIIDSNMHKPLNQAIAIIGSTKNEKISREFIEYINIEGKPVMEKYGFISPISNT